MIVDVLYFIIETMDQEDLYDEFGNYIGPEIESEDSSEQRPKEQQEQLPAGIQKVLPVANEHRIVLHEDKKFYQSHEEMYPGAEIMIEQEDRQTLETPLVSTEADKSFDYEEPLQTYYETQYLLDLLKNPHSTRNVCVAGHLHHGKTAIMDLLVQQTHLRKPDWNLEKNYRWLDSRIDEQERQLSIKATPISLLLPDLTGKHYACNFVDAPGHPNFMGEMVAGLRVCDGVLLVVDAVEGVMLMTEKVIKHVLRERLGVVVVINKIDRLIVQMKIPPEDAYLKIKHTLEEINGLFLKFSQQLGVPQPPPLSPLHDNVLFASAEYSFMFSLRSFAAKYQQIFKEVDSLRFSSLLWGDYYFNRETRKFQRKPQEGERKRTFVEFVLQPIYKIFAHTVGKDRPQLQQFLQRNLQLMLAPQEYRMNIKTLIKLIMGRYFGENKCLANSLISHIQAPHQRAQRLVNAYYRGDGEFKQLAATGKSDGPLLLNIVKLYHARDYKTFFAFGRVISGTIKKGDRLKIMGENYMTGDEEDLFVKTAGKIYLLQGRYRIEVAEAVAGNLIIVQGIDQAITKTATITHADSLNTDIMVPLKFWSQPTIKVAIEPLVPSELPKMMQAIRRANKSYLLLKTKVEESGQHILIGNGELHLDCILHDIRLVYSDVQCRISDPTVIFSETVIETSGIPCYADTPNHKNRIKSLAGPLEKGIAEHVQKELIDVTNPKEVKTFLQTKFDWDILAASNIWSFGPQTFGTNALINDSLATGTNQAALGRSKQSIVQGFRWSTKEGPLCDEPMRNVKFRVIDATLSELPGECAPGQMIPTARRAFYSAFLTANPRMMEPVYYTEIHCTTKESIQAVFAVLAKRRGSVQNDVPKIGTPHYIIKALIPCIEALGFETDLRVHTVGQAFCLSTFDHWQTLPGDPLDKKIVLRPLEVLEPHELAREFMLKTRRRKGLNEEVSIVKYFDDLNIKQLLKNDASFKEFI